MADGGKIEFPNGGSVEIVDPDQIVPAYADLITELREVDGVVYLSLASYIIDGDDSAKKARVISRLRISRSRAAAIYGALGNMLAGPKDGDTPKQSMN